MLRLLFPGLMLVAIVVAGCTGGSKSSPLIPIPTATPAPTAQATTAPLSASTTTPVTFGAVSGPGGGTAISSATVTLPQTNGAANATLTMQATLPAGAATPSLRKLSGRKVIGGTNINPLAYFIFSVNSTVTISSWPGFTVGFPTSVSGMAYVAILDTSSASNTWQVISAPLTASGNTLTFPSNTFAPPAAPFTFAPGVNYDYVIFTATAVPTTVGVAPVPTTTPAYCAGFATASPDPAIAPYYSPQPLFISDQSGLSDDVVLYVTDTGQDKNGAAPTSGSDPVYMRGLNQQGQWSYPSTPPAAGTLVPVPPLPLACFPGSILHNGQQAYLGLQFMIPISISGRIYVALSPKSSTPSVTAPNPMANALAFQHSGNAAGFAIQAPSIDWQSAASTLTPWDFLEYCLVSTACETDTTQENAVGLPLEVSQPAVVNPSQFSPGDKAITQGTVDLGFGATSMMNVMSDLSKTQTYDTLPVYAPFGSQGNYLLRIIAPQSAADYGFPQDWWYNNVNYLYQNTNQYVSTIDQTAQGYYSSSFAAENQGYIGYLLSSYAQTPQTYTIFGTTSNEDPTTNDAYCVTASVANGTFTFTEVGSVSTATPNPCASASPPQPVNGGNQFTLTAWNMLEGNPEGAGTVSVPGWCTTAVFGMAPGNPGVFSPALANWSDFYLWKAMVIDIARGMANQNVVHPASLWNTGSGDQPPSPSFSTYWQDPVYNQWAYILHKEMLQNRAYALQYDELGGMSTSFKPSLTGQPLTITIHQIPAAPAGAPTVPAYTSGTNSNPWATPAPLSCLTGPITP